LAAFTTVIPLLFPFHFLVAHNWVKRHCKRLGYSSSVEYLPRVFQSQHCKWRKENKKLQQQDTSLLLPIVSTLHGTWPSRSGLLPDHRNMRCSAPPQWTETSETTSKWSFPHLNCFCQVFCHSNKKLCQSNIKD
jgi:hypothetical protein